MAGVMYACFFFHRNVVFQHQSDMIERFMDKHVMPQPACTRLLKKY